MFLSFKGEEIYFNFKHEKDEKKSLTSGFSGLFT